MGGVGCTYDADGNLTYDGTNTYTYNSLNQMVSVTGPSGTTTYTYNSLGQRVASTTGGVTTQYVTDPAGLGNIVGQYTAGTVAADYVYGLGLTSQVTATGSYYYDSDLQGSIVGATGAAGEYVNKYSYLPFGAILSSSQSVSNPFQFIGSVGVMSEPDGMQYMRARYEAPNIGRFVSEDPSRSPSPNDVTYAGNDPINAIDPSGLNWAQVKDLLVGLGRLVNAADSVKNAYGAVTDDWAKVQKSLGAAGVGIEIAGSAGAELTFEASAAVVVGDLTLALEVGGGDSVGARNRTLGCRRWHHRGRILLVRIRQ